MPALDRQNLTELRRHVVETFRKGGGSRPDVLLLRVDNEYLVLKDFNACDRWFGRVIGPLLVIREARALGRLRGVRGIPELVGRPDARSLLLEYLPAVPITRFSGEVDWRRFFGDLSNLLRIMHARGVAHCDLRSPKNTLIDANSRPAVVDFVAHIGRSAGWNLPGVWVFRRFVQADIDALIKLKNYVAPELLDGRERRRLHHTRLGRGIRWVGVQIRNLSRYLFIR